MSRSIQFRVKGRVQGVGFRYSAQDAATNLNLNGWIRNRSDGDVEGVVQGNDSDVEQFLNWLWKGPAYARVIDVQATEDKRGDCLGFNIVR